MGRIGYDKKVHPFVLQLQLCNAMYLKGLESTNSISINFQDGIIITYRTDNKQNATMIEDYATRDDEMKELYGFFTLDALKGFEAIPEDEIKQYEVGCYDNSMLRYSIICGDGQTLSGKRTRIYNNDPINMIKEWIRRVVPAFSFG